MKTYDPAVRGRLVWLLLTACVILAACALLSGVKPPQKLSVAAAGRRYTPEAVQLWHCPVDLTDASALDELPGVGEMTAQAIIAEQRCNGPFFYPEDLMHVSGIGPKKLEDILSFLNMTEE